MLNSLTRNPSVVRRPRTLLAAAALALFAATAAFALAGGGAEAQSGNNTNPNVYQTALEGGEKVDDFIIRDPAATAYNHVELRVASAGGRTPATYLDLGTVAFWMEQLPSGDLLLDDQFFNSTGAAAGTQMAQCQGGNVNRCELTKAEWQALAGQTGAPDSATVNPITVAFSLPASLRADTEKIRFRVAHYPQDAVRSEGSRTVWGPNRDWTILKYGVIVIPVDAEDNPLYHRNSLTQAVAATTPLQYAFAAGQLSHVRISLGASRALEASGSPDNDVTYGDFTGAWLTLQDPAGAAVMGTNNQNGWHRELFFTTDGEPFAPCADNADRTQCIITSDEWKAAAGTPDAADSAVVQPIRFAIKAPRVNHAGNPWNGAKFRIQFTMDGTPPDQAYQNRRAEFTRLSAQISRHQSAYRNEDGSWGGPIAPDMNSDVADDKHEAAACLQAHVEAGAGQTSDCTRDLEIGESVYLQNVLRLGGATDNTGRNADDWFGGGAWLRADAAKPGVFYDRVQVQASMGGTPGGGVVTVGSLCPIGSSAEPVHPSAKAGGDVPRARTAEGLATCIYQSRAGGGTYWGGTGPNFIPTATGTVTVTLSYLKGQDDASTTGIDESLVAMDAIDIDVVAATDNTDAGNGGSDWDESDVVAELGSRSREDSLVLLIGHRRNRGIPEFWRGLSSPTGPGSIKGATYATVHATEAVQLTVPAGAGTIALLGAEKSCTAGAAACTLTISREDLKQAALYGGPSGTAVADITDATPYWPARLHFEHAQPKDVTISGVLKLADGTTTDDFEYVAKGKPANSGASIGAWLTDDADDVLAPAQVARIAVGYAVPDADENAWRIWSATPAFYEITGYVGDIPTLGFTAAAAQDEPLPATMRGAYLQLGGAAIWTETGGDRLWLDDAGYDYYKCVDDEDLTGADGQQRICYVADADGNAPQITVGSGASGSISVVANVPIWTSFGAAAPDETTGGGPDSSYLRPQNAHSPERFFVFGRASVPVDQVNQVAAVALTRKAGQTGAVKTGEPARLKLGITNENGRASLSTAISSITLTTTSGKIRAGSEEGEKELCDGSTTCTFTIGTAGDNDDDDLASLAAANPALIAGIFVDLYDVKVAGSATVSATVVATSGDDPVFSAEPLTVVFSGSAASLSLSEKLLRVNAYDTVGDDPATDEVETGDDQVDAGDTRDQIKIAVTAADSRGQTADIPRGSPTVLDPDGKRVTSGISAALPDDECNAGRTACNIVIEVNAPASSPLKSGVYKVRLSSGSLTDAETSFGVAGDPAQITIELDDPTAVGTRFEAEILVVDEAGEPVADGTQVAVAVERRGRAPAAVQRVSAAAQRTVNGRVTAAFVVIGREVSTIKATSGSASTLAVADTREVQTPDEDRPSQSLRTSETNTYTTWSGAGAATASDLLRDLGSAADRVFLWNGVRWLVYAEPGGRPIPGSINYLIQANDVLWIGSPVGN